MALSVAAHKNTVAAISVLLCAGTINFGAQNIVSAQQNIHAIICTNGASLHIERPSGDSVITTSSATLSGTVGQANQLEVYVDDQLDSIVSLPVGATTFQATVQLAPGTRTIKIVAIDTCQSKNATASIVMTYQPAVTASTGSATPTQIEGGVVIGGAPASTEVSTQNPIERIVTGPLRNVADVLDLIPTTAVASPAGISQPVRLALVASGAALVTFSSALLGVEWINRLLHLAALRIGLRQGYGAQLVLVTVGLLAVALAFLL